MYTSNLGAAGLYTFPNPLTITQPNALSQADNVVITADQIVQSRRGETFIGASLDLADNTYLDRIFEYQQNFIVHDTNNNLYYTTANPFTSPTWATYSGTFVPPTGATRLRGIEANKNWYMTTNNGITKQSIISANPISSGVPPALDLSATLVSGSWLANTYNTAYQVSWQYTDLNNNVIEGAPSELVTISNASGSAKAVSLTFTIPAGITTSYTYNIYRALQATGAPANASNVQLAVQGQPTSGQISAKAITVTDTTPDALLGTTSYWSASQQTAEQLNYPPPLALDMCLFSQMVFYANTTTLENIYLNMITTPSNGDTFVINGITFTASNSTQDPTSNLFEIVTGGTPAENIDATARNLVACINQSTTNSSIYAYYISGYQSLPGQMYFTGRNYTISSFALTSSAGSTYRPTLPTSGTTISSTNDNEVSSVFVSKVGQPEAVPFFNQLFIGGGDQAIIRILPLRNSVLVFKTDGIFRITGSSPDALTVTPFDNTVFIIAPDSAVLLNNSVFAMTSQMVVSVSESGVEIESRPIEGDLLVLSTLTNFSTLTYGITYESEREYVLCLPAENTDATAQHMYVYNWLLRAWTHWTIPTSAGLVSQQPDNKLYFGVEYNPSYIYQEVKTYNPSGYDFGDDRFPVEIQDIFGVAIQLDSVEFAEIGQTLSQGLLSSVVVGLNIPAQQVIVADDLGWNIGDAFLVRPINQIVLSTPIHAGFPHYLKNWTNVVFDFGATNFSGIEAVFTSNIDLSADTVVLTPAPGGTWGNFLWGSQSWGGNNLLTQAIPTLMTQNKSLANWVQVGLNLNQALTNFKYLGCTLTYDIVSDKLR